MTDHLTREQLLYYLDGELPNTVMRMAGVHLQSCWGCRTELERLQADIGTIHDAQKQVLLRNLPPPPRPWASIEPRLEAAPNALRIGWRTGRFLYFLRRPISALILLAGLLAVCMLLWLNPRAVSAAEILRRAAEADALRMRPPARHYVRQRVRITKAVHGSTSKQFGEVESWRSSAGVYWLRTDSDRAAEELQKRYHDRDVADLPLSALSYQAWAKEANAVGQVSRASAELVVNYAASGQGSTANLQKVSLHVRPADWHVIQMELDFVDAQFDISEEDLAILPRSEVPLSVLARLEPSAPTPDAPAVPAKPVVAGTAELSAIPTVRSVNPDEREMDVRVTLHQIGADLGEPVEIARESSGLIVVSAWNAAPARRELLRQILGDKADVRLELQPPAALQTLAPEAASLPTTPSIAARDSRPPSWRPDEERLAKWFGSAAAQEDFTRSVLSTSTDLLSRLYAVKELADRWPPKSESQLSETARTKLAAMILDHARTAAQRCTELRLMTKRLIEAFASDHAESAVPSAPREWQVSARESLEAAKDADRLLRALLTTSDDGLALDEALLQLQQKLAVAETRISSVLSPKQ